MNHEELLQALYLVEFFDTDGDEIRALRRYNQSYKLAVARMLQFGKTHQSQVVKFSRGDIVRTKSPNREDTIYENCHKKKKINPDLIVAKEKLEKTAKELLSAQKELANLKQQNKLLLRSIDFTSKVLDKIPKSKLLAISKQIKADEDEKAAANPQTTE